MISFHICTNAEEFTQLAKDNEALYFVPAYGIYKGDTICADYSSDSIVLIHEILVEIQKSLDNKAENSALASTDKALDTLSKRVTIAETNIGKKVDETTYSTKVQALDQKDIALQNDIEKKLNIANPAATGTFTLADDSGHNASFVYDGSALTITLS